MRTFCFYFRKCRAPALVGDPSGLPKSGRLNPSDRSVKTLLIDQYSVKTPTPYGNEATTLADSDQVGRKLGPM